MAVVGVVFDAGVDDVGAVVLPATLAVAEISPARRPICGIAAAHAAGSGFG